MDALRRMWAFVPAGRDRWYVVAGLATRALSSVAALVPAFVVYKLAVDLLDPNAGSERILPFALAAFLAVQVRLASLGFGRALAATATMDITRRLRARIADRIGNFPLGDLSERGAGSFEAVALNDVDDIGAFFYETLGELIAIVAMLSAASVLLCVYDWRLAAVTIAICFVAWNAAGGLRFHFGDERERERAARESFAVTALAAIRTLALERSLPSPARTLGSSSTLARDYRESKRSRSEAAATIEGVAWSVAATLPALMVLIALSLGTAQVPVTTALLFGLILLRCSGTLLQMFGLQAALRATRHAVRRIDEFFERPVVRDGDIESPGDGSIRFDGVSFAYPGGSLTLRDVSFTAAAGKVTAIVGPSGAGKTTLTRLAARFWDVDAGSVQVGSVDVRDYPLDALMRRIALVFQDVALLDDTVAVNLRLGRAEATDVQLIAAAKASGAHEFIMALPLGYDTAIGERGMRLSRGERQRLQIARALLKDAPVVILDEPTASLDPITELEIQNALAVLLRGKTVLVVAHRLATVSGADRIVVLGGDGRVEAAGTHGELLQQSPTYARLWQDYTGSIDWRESVRA